MKNSLSLKEMSLKDENGYLVWLSYVSEIQYFKNIILITNYEDGYTPHESAKIVVSDKLKKPMIWDMAWNIYHWMNA